MNRVSVAIGLAALQRDDDVQRFLDDVKKERERLYRTLRELPLKVYPSAANFLFVASETNLQETLLEQGILIRSFQNGTYRITVGTTDENNRLIQALKEVFS